MKELKTAINLGAALKEILVRRWGTCMRRSPWPQICAFLSNWLSLESYPHHFGNLGGTFVFPNQGIAGPREDDKEMVVVRSPRGTQFSHRIDIKEYIEWVIYRIESVGIISIYLGTLTYVGASRAGKFLQAREKK